MGAAALLAASVLTGCGLIAPEATATPTVPPTPTHTYVLPPTTPTPTLSPLSGRVVIWLDWGPEEMASLVRLVSAFHEQHPRVEFSLAYFPSEELPAAFDRPAPGIASPTMVFGPDTWGPKLWRAGRIQDVSDLLAPGLRQSLLPVALQQVLYGGAVVGIPIQLEGVVLYVNREWMPGPAPDMWALIDVATQSRTTLDYGFAFTGAFLRTCGAQLLDERGDPAFAGVGGTCWLELLRTLAMAGRVVYNSDDDLRRFAEGQAAWLIDGTWQRQFLRDSIGEQSLAINPWPVYTVTGEPLAGYIWTENAYLLEGLNPADREANWEFIRFLISLPVQQMLADPDGAAHLPVTAGVLSPDPLMSQAMAVLEKGVPYPILPEVDFYPVPMERSGYAVLRQGADLGLAQLRALSQIRQALAEARASPP